MENSYEVYASNVMYYYNEEVSEYDWVEDDEEYVGLCSSVEDKRICKETKRVFKTYKKALKYARELAEEVYCNEKNPTSSTINSVFIYDDVSGEVYSCINAIHKDDEKLFNKYYFDILEHEDVGFTREKMGDDFK